MSHYSLTIKFYYQYENEVIDLKTITLPRRRIKGLISTEEYIATQLQSLGLKWVTTELVIKGIQEFNDTTGANIIL